jgi:hypothetical protein
MEIEIRVRDDLDQFQLDLQSLHRDWEKDDLAAETRWRQADAMRDVAEVAMERSRISLAAALIIEGMLILEGN